MLFLGAQGTQQSDEEKGDGPASLTFKFKAGLNDDALFVGQIGPIEKKAHDYLWIVYADEAGTESRIKKPIYVYVNKIFSQSDFNELGIG